NRRRGQPVRRRHRQHRPVRPRPDHSRPAGNLAPQRPSVRRKRFSPEGLIRIFAHSQGNMKKSKQDELVFLPLGGSNEIGMNLNAYGFGPAHDRKWIIVDVGVTFGDLSTPGVDVITPDPTFLEGENILGIVLTHAHEDHIRALGWLWPRL